VRGYLTGTGHAQGKRGRCWQPNVGRCLHDLVFPPSNDAPRGDYEPLRKGFESLDRHPQVFAPATSVGNISARLCGTTFYLFRTTLSVGDTTFYLGEITLIPCGTTFVVSPVKKAQSGAAKGKSGAKRIESGPQGIESGSAKAHGDAQKADFCPEKVRSKAERVRGGVLEMDRRLSNRNGRS
jgi:hypothetical protein